MTHVFYSFKGFIAISVSHPNLYPSPNTDLAPDSHHVLTTRTSYALMRRDKHPKTYLIIRQKTFFLIYIKGIQVSVEWSRQQPKRVKHNEKKKTL